LAQARPARANHAVRHPIRVLGRAANALRPEEGLLQQPEAYLSGTAEIFDAHGKLQSHDTAKFLDKFVQAFAAWITRIRAPSPTQA
jgi:hypothetical protein